MLLCRHVHRLRAQPQVAPHHPAARVLARVKNRTLANLTHWPAEKIEASSGSRSESQTSAGQRLGEKRQALVHPVIDTGVVVGELLIAMGNAKLVEPPHKPTGTI
jgi:hypothetical protein